jgi:hypothetical protein
MVQSDFHWYAGCLKEALQWYSKCYRVASVRKTFILYLPFERWIIFTYLSVNVFVTLATGQHLEFQCEALLEKPVFALEGNILDIK